MYVLTRAHIYIHTNIHLTLALLSLDSLSHFSLFFLFNSFSISRLFKIRKRGRKKKRESELVEEKNQKDNRKNNLTFDSSTNQAPTTTLYFTNTLYLESSLSPSFYFRVSNFYIFQNV